MTQLELQTTEYKGMFEDFDKLVKNKLNCKLKILITIWSWYYLAILKVLNLIDADGLTIGESNDNPLLDTCIYEVEYP